MRGAMRHFTDANLIFPEFSCRLWPTFLEYTKEKKCVPTLQIIPVGGETQYNGEDQTKWKMMKNEIGIFKLVTEAYNGGAINLMPLFDHHYVKGG